MLQLFVLAEADGKINKYRTTRIAGRLRSGVGFQHKSTMIHNLTNDVVGWNLANQHYQGHRLGNLQAGDSSAKLMKLVDKWFYGEDLPGTDKFSRYEHDYGSLICKWPILRRYLRKERRATAT